MKKEIELIRYVRANILNQIEALTLEQLNRIPEKFNNNIAWNLAHLVITQQSMSYRLGGYPTHIDDEWFAAFVPGTKPQKDLTAGEVAMIRSTLKTTIDQFEQDYNAHQFKQYTPWTIPSGMEVKNIEDSFKISCVHEGRHYGVITSLIKLVS